MGREVIIFKILRSNLILDRFITESKGQTTGIVSKTTIYFVYKKQNYFLTDDGIVERCNLRDYEKFICSTRISRATSEIRSKTSALST